jgi:hypothetical protein
METCAFTSSNDTHACAICPLLLLQHAIEYSLN